MDALVLCGALHTGAAMVLFGALAVRPLLAPPPSGTAAAEGAGERRLIVAAAWLGLASAVAWLLLESAAMADDMAAMVDPEAVAAVLGGTLFGRVWQWHLILAVATVGASVRRRHARLLLVLAALQLASLGLIGHAAMEEGAAGFFQRATQAVHLLAGGAWLGSLPSLLLLAAARHDAAATGNLERALRRFSGFGATAVALLLLSGSINVWVRTGGRLDPLGSPYDRIVLIKLALVAVMVAVALVNRFLLTPSLARSPERSRNWLRVSVAAEMILGAAVLLAAFILGSTAPS